MTSAHASGFHTQGQCGKPLRRAPGCWKLVCTPDKPGPAGFFRTFAQHPREGGVRLPCAPAPGAEACPDSWSRGAHRARTWRRCTRDRRLVGARLSALSHPRAAACSLLGPAYGQFLALEIGPHPVLAGSLSLRRARISAFSLPGSGPGPCWRPRCPVFGTRSFYNRQAAKGVARLA